MKKLNKLNIIQKIGLVFIGIGALVVFPDNNAWYHDWLQTVLLVGQLLLAIPFFIRKRNAKVMSLVLFSLLSAPQLFAQDYSQQVNAFKQSFKTKSLEPIKPYIGKELKFDPIPIANTAAILKNIVTKLPQLNSLTILETSANKVQVKYDFAGLGVRESAIHFDGEAKFARIELVENLIQQELKVQQKTRESVQEPPLTELAKNHQPVEVEFESDDGLVISGNLYELDKNSPVILLAHQAGYNRMEYLDIAPRLNSMGYNCLAIDQRSGGDFANKPNKTAQNALNKGLNPSMAEAKKDIHTAINYLKQRYGGEFILWGSSYSASLSILEGIENDDIKAIIAFSPGDYFGDELPSLTTAFSNTDKHFLITSSKEEATTLTALLGGKKLSEYQYQFIPASEGFHGSKALWTGQKGAEEYWKAVTEFLKTIDD